MILLLGLGRVMSPEWYGVFSLAYAGQLLIATVLTSVILEPMSVFAGRKFASCRAGYVRAVVRWSFRLGLLGACGLGAAAAVCFSMSWRLAAEAFLGLALALPFVLASWTVRRAGYLSPEWSRAPVWFSLAYLLATASLLVGLVLLRRVSVLAALLVLGASSGIAAGVGWARLRAHGLGTPGEPELQGAWQDHLRYARFSLPAALLGWTGNIYYYLLPVLHGISAAGELRALMNLVYPVLQINQALSNHYLPLLSRLAGRVEFGRELRQQLLRWVVLATLYGAALAVAGQRALGIIYGDVYRMEPGLLVLAALLPLLDGCTYFLSNSLKASLRLPQLMQASLFMSASVILAGMPLALWYGLRGAIEGMLFTSTVYLLATAGLAWVGKAQPQSA
jgi:hypothetical protein